MDQQLEHMTHTHTDTHTLKSIEYSLKTIVADFAVYAVPPTKKPHLIMDNVTLPLSNLFWSGIKKNYSSAENTSVFINN